jgi:hypothetical protein
MIAYTANWTAFAVVVVLAAIWLLVKGDDDNGASS